MRGFSIRQRIERCQLSGDHPDIHAEMPTQGIQTLSLSSLSSEDARLSIKQTERKTDNQSKKY
jgi:hypothetical protein